MVKQSKKNFIQIAKIGLLTLPITLFGDKGADREAFLKRRIVEFAKDEDYKTVQKQIESFLKEYPDSNSSDDFKALQAEVYLMEKNYQQALGIYEKIQKDTVKDKIVINLMQCYYEKKEYQKILLIAQQYTEKDNEYIQKKQEVFNFLLAESNFHIAKQDLDENKFTKAQSLYENLLDSPYALSSKFSLAQIYKHQGAFEQASEYFLELSNRHNELTEELLFHAALCQAEFDRTSSIATFNQIIEINGKKINDAKLNRLILLFQNEEYQTIVDEVDSAKSLAMLENNEQVYYLIGHSFFKLKEFHQTNEYLKKYANSCDKKSDTYRNALLMQLNAVKNLESEEEYSAIISDLKENFSGDTELAKAIFIHAMMLKDQGKTIEAEATCKNLLKDYPEFKDKESLLLQMALLSHTNQNFDASHDILKEFIAKYPNNKQLGLAYKYYLSSSIERLKISEDSDKRKYTKSDFLEDLTLVLKQDNILSINEEKEARFLQAKACYELEQFDNAIVYFQNYLNKYENDSSCTQANLLIALCHHKIGSEAEKFCVYAERALEQDSEIKTKSAIHLELYNVYLSMLENSETQNLEITLDNDKKCQVIDLAAEHLYKAAILEDLPLQLENRLWLVNYYYKKIATPSFIYDQTIVHKNDDNKSHYQRSLDIYTNIFKSEKESKLRTIDQKHLYLESEALKFISLISNDQLNEKISLLESLVEQQSKNETWDWKLKNEVMVELAKSYELANQNAKAFETYDFIAKKDKTDSNFTTQYAYIHSSRLKFSLMHKEEKHTDNHQVIDLLERLKEMQIKKSALSEPVHIDAAIEYARVRQALADNKIKASRYLFFLERIKADYESETDPIAINYHKDLNQRDDKKSLYQSYMTFISAEILRTKALIEGSENKALQIEFSKKANDLLVSLDGKNKTHYLHMQIQLSLNLIKENKLF